MRLGIAVTGWTLAGMLGAGSAGAVEPPKCWQDDAWARPGIQRSYVLYCPHSDQVSVASAPDHVAVSGVAVANDVLEFSLLPDSGAAQEETLQVHLSGPVGEATVPIHVHVVPLSQNTAPSCEPVTLAQRTDGAGPATLDFHISCLDAEHDDYTLDGGGPGTHVGAPKLVRPAATQEDVGWWHYQTAAFSGHEQTTYWATDEFGARSQDAPIDIDIGPAVDRKPTCETIPFGVGGATVLTVSMRPGATRRFGVMCTDPDGDDVAAQVTTPPTKGAITTFEDTGPSAGFWGLSRAIDVTYAPASAVEGQDDFTIGVGGPKGAGPDVAVQLVTRTLDQDSGAAGGCSIWWAQTSAGQQVDVHARCSNAVGDPLSATLVDPPSHGQAGTPALTAAPFGETDINVPYLGDDGFSGTDYMTVHVSNGSGFGLSFELQVTVYGHQDMPSIFPPGTTYLDFMDPPATPPPAQAQLPSDLARAALGTKDVRAIGTVGAASVFAPRAALRVVASQPAIAVACQVACRVGVTSEVRAGKRGRRHRRASHFTATPGKARAIALRLDRAERRRLRRLHSATAVFRLTVSSGRKTSVASIPLRIHVRR